MTTTQKPETFMLSSEAQQSLPQDAQVALQQVDNLKYFLISAPVDWAPDQYIRRFLLPTGEYVSCVLWNNLFHVSGTDIVRCLSFRFQAFGRPVKNSKKFEEGIFSDLRNLKAGTDASLEEPKSPFLDFLYKNNCIRTQKKQKVFYWYSVPHDRLFLDALERDLKREKMSQEPTTVAVNEPALSFEFDSSQSLFEQLTKAQQANTSSFAAAAAAAAATTNAAVAVNYSQSNSPVMRAMDSMPPPPTVPQPMGALVPDDVHQMAIYTAAPLPMSAALPHGHLVKRELDGMALSRAQPRHASMPAYMEYSPAPSFVSSHYEDYSNRGVSFEPLTPPQQPMPLGAEPAYIANEDTGLYTAIPDVGASTAYGNMVQLPPSNLAGSQYGGIRTFGGGVPANNPYGMLEGSPTYKQRRRRSPGMGMGMGMVAVGGSVVNPHAPLRPSDLRRSVSSSVVPMPDGIESMRASPQVQPNHYAGMAQPKELIDLSRNTTPMPTLEASPAPIGLMQPHGDLSHVSCAPGAELEHPVHSSPAIRPMPGVLRRARSATITDMGPYPHKSHSCPIPSCGRLFKRLEHLKRHVRTHTQERPYICKTCNKGFSRSDNLAQHRRIHEQQMDGEGDGNYDSNNNTNDEGEDVDAVNEEDNNEDSASGASPNDISQSPARHNPPPGQTRAHQQYLQHHAPSTLLHNGANHSMSMPMTTNPGMSMPAPSQLVSAAQMLHQHI